jgi:dimethylargininase
VLILKQHEEYIKSLEKCGLKVEVLQADENFPDGNYVEDVAVLTDEFAIITNPGAESRRDEIENIKAVINKYYDNLEHIKTPGSLEGGDVMKVGKHFYVGISERTNEEGAEQFFRIVEKYGYTGSTVKVSGVLHLKTGMSYMEDGTLLVTGDFLEYKDSAVNCIRLNDFVLMPEGFEKTKLKLKEEGYDIVETPMSEFQKMDGGLTCLSLRFKK